MPIGIPTISEFSFLQETLIEQVGESDVTFLWSPSLNNVDNYTFNIISPTTSFSSLVTENTTVTLTLPHNNVSYNITLQAKNCAGAATSQLTFLLEDAPPHDGKDFVKLLAT